MLIQAVIQHLLGKRKKEIKTSKSATEQELSPMAQSIMQKLAEHEKNKLSDSKSADNKDQFSTKSDL